MITKGPQLILEANHSALDTQVVEAVYCTYELHMLVCRATSLFVYNRAKESMKSTAIAVGR